MRAVPHQRDESGQAPSSLVRAHHPFTTTAKAFHVANIKSQMKRIGTNEKAHERNKAVKSELKTRVKNAKASAGSDSSVEDVRLAVKRIDMAAAKGIIHKNTAARRKSRLMKSVNSAD